MNFVIICIPKFSEFLTEKFELGIVNVFLFTSRSLSFCQYHIIHENLGSAFQIYLKMQVATKLYLNFIVCIIAVV